MTHDFQNGRCVKCQVSLETFNERWGMVACVPSVDVSWNVNASPVECLKEANEKILKETGYAPEAFDVTFTPRHSVSDDNSTQEPQG